MRKWLAGFAVLTLIGLVASPVLASTLAEKQHETSFALSYEDVDNFGKTTSIDGQWQWIFGKGYNELGALLSYLKVSPDSGSSTDATIIGPIYTFNWMPDNDKATGFVEGAYGFVSGDLSDFFDAAWQASVGAKVFVGDSAAIRFDVFHQSLLGADNFDDQDSDGFRIGISIFAGKK
jgi:hypothetical protein